MKRGARRPGTSPGSLLVGPEDLHELVADHGAAAETNERLAALLRAQGDAEGAEFFEETARYYREAAVSFGTGRGARAAVAIGKRSPAAGVAIVTGRGRTRRILLLQRLDGGWETPGGGLEPGESPWQAARRETFEEVGWTPPLRSPRARTVGATPTRDPYTLFLVTSRRPFTPTLDEHRAARWVPVVDLWKSRLGWGLREELWNLGLVR